MKIVFPDKTEKNLSFGSARIEDIIVEIGYNPGSVIVVRNGRIVPEDIEADDSDELRIIVFSHGG